MCTDRAGRALTTAVKPPGRSVDRTTFLSADYVASTEVLATDSAGAAIVVQRIFESVFGIDSSTELRFVGSGLPPAG